MAMGWLLVLLNLCLIFALGTKSTCLYPVFLSLNFKIWEEKNNTRSEQEAGVG